MILDLKYIRILNQPFSGSIKSRYNSSGLSYFTKPCLLSGDLGIPYDSSHWSRRQHGVGIYFEKKPTKEQVEVIKERSVKFAARVEMEVVGFRLQITTTATEETTRLYEEDMELIGDKLEVLDLDD